MVLKIKLACDATPQFGAGICVFYEQGETTSYILHGPKRHNYGTDSSNFEMRNVINVVKKFKREFESGASVQIYSDNDAIMSDDFPVTRNLVNQVEQIQAEYNVDITLIHDTIDNNRLMAAADELSRARQQKCEQILAKIGALPLEDD